MLYNYWSGLTAADRWPLPPSFLPNLSLVNPISSLTRIQDPFRGPLGSVFRVELDTSQQTISSTETYQEDLTVQAWQEEESPVRHQAPMSSPSPTLSGFMVTCPFHIQLSYSRGKGFRGTEDPELAPTRVAHVTSFTLQL